MPPALETCTRSHYSAADCFHHAALPAQGLVEGCFADQGSLLPNFHKFYWMGLRTGIMGATWPNFTWIDRDNVVYVGDYQHWGVMQPGFILEPNNLVPPENCAGSNLTMGIVKFDKTFGVDEVGGWADQPCQAKHPYICELSPQRSSPFYTAKSTGSVFSFHPEQLSQSQAEAACNELSGHLASYADIFEQVRRLAEVSVWPCCLATLRHCHDACLLSVSVDGALLGLVLQGEVEAYFIEQGNLLPSFHKAYWLGLAAASQQTPKPAAGTPYGGWRWLDFLPPPSKSTYTHWGTLTLSTGRGRPEPNNLVPPEVCAAANASQAFDEPSAWGWADAPCGIRLPYICKTLRE